jgi:hypothetical protein
VDEGRKLLIAMALSCVAIAAVAIITWNIVAAAQSSYAAEVATMYTSAFSLPMRALSATPQSPAQVPQVSLAGVPTRLAELSMARSAMGWLACLVIFGGCLTVAYYSESALPALVIGGFGWAVNGVLSGALSSHAVQLVGSAPASFAGSLVTWAQPAGGGPPFGLYVALGLVTSVLWQGAVPTAAGWFAGSRIRAWRASSLDFSLTPAAEGLPPNRRRCACGAINLAYAESCYACGAQFSAVDDVEVVSSEGPVNWRAREWT